MRWRHDLLSFSIAICEHANIAHIYITYNIYILQVTYPIRRHFKEYNNAVQTTESAELYFIIIKVELKVN